MLRQIKRNPHDEINTDIYFPCQLTYLLIHMQNRCFAFIQLFCVINNYTEEEHVPYYIFHQSMRLRAPTHTHTQCNIVLAKTDPGSYVSGPIV